MLMPNSSRRLAAKAIVRPAGDQAGCSTQHVGCMTGKSFRPEPSPLLTVSPRPDPKPYPTAATQPSADQAGYPASPTVPIRAKPLPSGFMVKVSAYMVVPEVKAILLPGGVVPGVVKLQMGPQSEAGASACTAARTRQK